MAEHENRQNAGPDNRQDTDQPKAMGAAAGATPPNTTDAQKLKAQTGGPQEDQIAGETPEGAHNQDNRNRNPTGGHPNQKQNTDPHGENV